MRSRLRGRLTFQTPEGNSPPSPVASSPFFSAQNLVESQDEVVVDVGDFEVLLTTEKGFCLIDDFLELRVQL